MTTLKSLSDKELLAETLKLRRREHKTTLEILVHLNEIERRRLHLKLGYRSLFDYCARHLKYSASAACRRIQTARCVRSHPEVYQLLEQEKVNLTTVSLVAPILTNENKREILEAICDRSQREVEAIASRYRPPVTLRDMVKPVRVHVPAHSRSGSKVPMSYGRSGSGFSLTPSESRSELSPGPPVSSGQNNSAMSNHHRSGGQDSSSRSPSSELSMNYSRRENESAERAEARTEQKLLIQFLADEAFMKKYEQARSLLSQRLTDTSFASVFDALINEFLECHSAFHRKARRDMKKKPHRPAPAKPRQAAEGHQRMHPSQSRHVPAAVRDEVFVRNKGRCTYVGKTGKRCDSTQALQIDHIVPFARGGPATTSNLRLLCGKHNRLAAEEILGEALIRSFTARALPPPRRE